MRKGLWTAALCALLASGAALAAGEMEPVPLEAAPAVKETGGGAREAAATPTDEAAAGGDFARMPPGADTLPEPAAPPMADESAVAVPDGNGTNMEAPAEDRAADQAAPPSPDGALPAPGESAGSRI